MSRHLWKDEALCLEYDTNIFFEKYEDNESLRHAVDDLCSKCPINKNCFAVGITGKEYGVWGGVYLEDGKISKEFNKHKTKSDWSNTWQNLTMDSE
jgi:hypothetical protein